MKRTPLWVFVAAVGLQIAALGLCIWAMEDFGHLEDDAQAPPEKKPAPLGALNPAPETISADVFSRPVPTAAAPAPVFGPPPQRESAAAAALQEEPIEPKPAAPA